MFYLARVIFVMPEFLKLPVTSLRRRVDLTNLTFCAEESVGLLGQTRAQHALAFGIAMKTFGYNIFVMGDPGFGRLSLVYETLTKHAKHQVSPASYAYVDNFDQPREPLALALPTNIGHQFNKDIESLLDALLVIFPVAFESPVYQQKKNAIERQFTQFYDQAISLVELQALASGIAVFKESDVISYAPIRDNVPLSDELLAQLPKAERESFYEQVRLLEDYLSDQLLNLPQWRRDMAEQIKQLNASVVCHAIAPLFTELHLKYQDIASVSAYLTEVERHLNLTIANNFMPGLPFDEQEPRLKKAALIEQYAPNILFNHELEKGAPVIYEPHPLYQNVFGRIEYSSDQGAMITNYRRICAGSLHKANGGYLILDAEKIIANPYVWDALKRALKQGSIEIESPFSEVSIQTMTLKPEIIPLQVKIILVGTAESYYLLEEYDEEFNELFKVLVDFDHAITLTEQTITHFAHLIKHHAETAQLLPITNAAIAQLLEHSCRLSEKQHKFSARIKDILDCVDEADLLSRLTLRDQIDVDDIEQALAAKEYRNGKVSQTILDDMLDGTILIDTEGEAIGKINGLTVLEMGGSSFGMPARITTTVSPGSRGIVDIEREAELGQAIHSKGVLILTGYLGHFYAQHFPLAISASIAIEQSYSFVDGDSASLAELCSLISALTGVAIKQALAITGSINQYGEVQAIGGVNEKIEGFFRLCQARGLTGQHGVIIPAANSSNLMLKKEVIDAVEKNLFAVYAVSTVNEALELLTGEIAGLPDKEGKYPEPSINYKAISRLKEIAEIAAEDDKEEE